MPCNIPTEEVLKFFENSDGYLDVLVTKGLDRVVEGGVVMDQCHVMAFIPYGVDTSALKRINDTTVSFSIERLKVLVELAEAEGSEYVCVSNKEGLPLFIESNKGVFMLAPRIGG